MVWSCFLFIRSGQNHLARHSERGGKDKAGRGRGGKTTLGKGQAWSSASPRGQWRTGEMEKIGCKIICGAPTTLKVKGLMMKMMLMMMMMNGLSILNGVFTSDCAAEAYCELTSN